ncbi:MAG TPA: LPS assembly protein LptD [Geobacteraceae bacterium]|nr:LPS assembly protein LptD [Geobacteraceae bacterium]
MRLATAITLLMLCFSTCLFPVVATAEDMLESGGITIYADDVSYDKNNNTYHATGNVMILWKGSILIADKASLDEAENIAEASGKVRLIKGGDVLNCDLIRINTVTEEGEAINGKLFDRRSNFHISGERFVRLGPEKYRLDHGMFTVCNGDEPCWKFTADQLEVNMEDFATGNDAIFYIKDVPSFYTPYLLFPVQRERQSGFLMPRIGNSNLKGVNMDIPYYWAISPSQDATFDLDLETKRGAGIGVDYNYKRENDSLGKIFAYSIFDTTENKLRGNFVTKQQEWFSPSLVFKSDVNLVSDRTFFLDYSEENGVYNQQITDSSVSLTKNWQNNSLAGEVRYVDDLLALNNRETFQKLPNINFTAIRQKVLDTPLYLALDSSFTNYYREDGQKGPRIDLHPFAQIYLSTPAGLDLSAWGGYRERLYENYGETTLDSTTSGTQAIAQGIENPHFRSIGLFNAGASVSTSFTRIYETNWGSLTKVRHTIVPEVGYEYVEEKNQDNLPFYDYNDRVLGYQMADWSLTNYITGKFQQGDAAPTYRDIFYLRLSQKYEGSGTAKDPLTGTPRDLLPLVDPGNRFTDVRIEGNFSPVPEFSILTDSRYNTYDTRFSTIMAGFDLTDGKGNKIGASYNYAREIVEYMEGKLTVNLVKPFIFNYTGRISLDKRGFLESLFSLEYKQQCWSVILAYHERPIIGDHAFTINFTLAGLGPLGKIKAF